MGNEYTAGDFLFLSPRVLFHNIWSHLNFFATASSTLNLLYKVSPICIPLFSRIYAALFHADSAQPYWMLHYARVVQVPAVVSWLECFYLDGVMMNCLILFKSQIKFAFSPSLFSNYSIQRCILLPYPA